VFRGVAGGRVELFFPPPKQPLDPSATARHATPAPSFASIAGTYPGSAPLILPGVIDLHCHILPGVDDGPATMEDALAMARVAWEDGVRTIVATPHVSHDFPTDPSEIAGRVDELNAAMQAAGVEIAVVRGAEVALTKLAELDRPAIELACIGDGPYLLLESPYQYMPDSLERIVFEAQLAGFRPVLAHPERSGCFHGRLERLRGLVERGVVTSVTAASVSGRFGKPVAGETRRFVSQGLVHNVASDGHGVDRRSPRLSGARERLGEEEFAWATQAVPAAIVAGSDLPARPEPSTAARGGLAEALRGIARLGRR
jgi:protein-tyrosine phosphatase